jgi:hypothetical protein
MLLVVPAVDRDFVVLIIIVCDWSAWARKNGGRGPDLCGGSLRFSCPESSGLFLFNQEKRKELIQFQQERPLAQAVIE